MPRTKDGHIYQNGIVTAGLETDAVVSSSPNLKDSYDVIVLGAGFAGLIAARDLSRNKDLKVLLLEGRDRIGGRTWTSKAFGEMFEMGGNWVHWCQPHIYAEISKYGLHKSLATTTGTANAQTMLYKPKGQPVLDLDLVTTQTKWESLATQFFAIDGLSARELMPYPHDPLKKPLQPWWKYDHLSVRDRLDQMKDVSEEDKDELEANFGSFGSCIGEEIAFTAALHWYALSGYSIEATYAAAGTFKLGGGGMTGFARRVLEDCDGDLEVGAKVIKVKQDKEMVEVICESGRCVEARRVVCTIPLNCLKDIEFDPPFDPLRKEAIAAGHRNTGAKIHYRVKETQSGWGVQTADRDASDLLWVFADRNANSASGAEGTYCMGFGYNGRLVDPLETEDVKRALLGLKPDVTIDSYLTHAWATDPFAKGVWYCASPDATSQYLEELQKPHGKITMASADWADGWRGFVDGAIEQGARAVVTVARDLAAGRATSNHLGA